SALITGGAQQPALSGLVRGTKDWNSTHSARKADAERACRELSWQATRGMPERELVLELVGCPAEDSSLAPRVQHQSAALKLGISNTGGVCTTGRFAFYSLR